MNLSINEVIIEPYMMADMLAEREANQATIRSLTAAELSNAEAAITKCTKAANDARNAAEKSGMNAKECRYRSIMAYKLSMPRMDTIDGCIEAVACAVNGMMAGLLDGAEVSKLLYAAQIAQSLLRSK
jgi:hypothetical protein